MLHSFLTLALTLLLLLLVPVLVWQSWNARPSVAVTRLSAVAYGGMSWSWIAAHWHAEFWKAKYYELKARPDSEKPEAREWYRLPRKSKFSDSFFDLIFPVILRPCVFRMRPLIEHLIGTGKFRRVASGNWILEYNTSGDVYYQDQFCIVPFAKQIRHLPLSRNPLHDVSKLNSNNLAPIWIHKWIAAPPTKTHFNKSNTLQIASLSAAKTYWSLPILSASYEEAKERLSDEANSTKDGREDRKS